MDEAGERLVAKSASKSEANSNPITMEFRQEFEAETLSLLHKRFLWFAGVVSVIGLLAVVAMAMMDLYQERDKLNIAGYGVAMASLAACVAAYLIVLLGHVSRERVHAIAFTIVVFDGLLHIGLWMFTDPHQGLGMWGVLLTHLLACCFLPWTAMQALGPIVVLVLVNAIAVVLGTRPNEAGQTPVALMIVQIGISPFVGLPGTLICWLRHSRRVEQFKMRAMATRYGEFRRELTDARKIHESLFPKPLASGEIHFHYLYEPMRQIGGDYLFVAMSPTDDGRGEMLSFVVVDVTGHGIPAALTVNRLHGELSRLFAEDPGIRPGDVLRLLNRYVHLTLANHSVYVTAVCGRIDPKKGVLEYASGGHPTAFLRAVDGTVEELQSTALVLGACPDAEFEPEPRELRFGPGDSLIAYTDGALEAKDKDGRMLGTKGMQRIVGSRSHCPSGSWPQVILGVVEQHRHGPPADDTLVIEVFRPLGTSGAGEATRAAAVERSIAQPYG